MWVCDRGVMRIFPENHTSVRRAVRHLPRLAVVASSLTIILGLTGYAANAASNSGAASAGTARLGAASLRTASWQGGSGYRIYQTTTTTAAPVTTTTAAPSGFTDPFRWRHFPTTTTTAAPVTTTTVAPTTTTVAPTTTTTAAPVTTTTRVPVTTTTLAPVVGPVYPVGISDATEPSGMAPPSATSLAGYSLNYVTDFTGTSLPSGWYSYSGQPGGDPGGQFGSAHTVVSGGLLQLNTWQDAAYGGKWVTGGLCQCGLAKTYGAYFVRSRVTGAGPTQVMLLWPKAPVWPPEVDFNETGGSVTGTSSTVHWSSTNKIDQRGTSIDMTKWHTWGVIWTASSITYTVDGRVWATVSVSSEIPNIAMTLDLQQQTWCSSGWACPTTPQSTLVDWVAEYSAS